MAALRLDAVVAQQGSNSQRCGRLERLWAQQVVFQGFQVGKAIDVFLSFDFSDDLVDVEGIFRREGQLNHCACVAAVLVEAKDQFLHLLFAYRGVNSNQLGIDSKFGHLLEFIPHIDLAGRIHILVRVFG